MAPQRPALGRRAQDPVQPNRAKPSGEGTMTLQVRRVVTGHDASGKAIVATDEVMTGVSAPSRPYISRCEIWSTDAMPVDNSESAAADAQRAGFVKRYNYVGTGQGTVV